MKNEKNKQKERWQKSGPNSMKRKIGQPKYGNESLAYWHSKTNDKNNQPTNQPTDRSKQIENCEHDEWMFVNWKQMEFNEIFKHFCLVSQCHITYIWWQKPGQHIIT